MTAPRSLGDRAVSAVLWLVLGRWGQTLLTVGTLVIMARFLGPEVYGAFALAALTMTLGETLVTGTFADTLVQRPNVEPRHIAAAFLFSVAPMLLLVGLSFAAAVPFAAALDAPGIADALPAMSLVALLIGLGAVPAALLQRDLRQRPLTLIDQGASTLASLSGIALAVAGAGLWSLVVMELVRAGCRTLALFRAARWRPSLGTDREALADTWAFGRQLLAIKLLQYGDRLVPRVALGLALGVAAVGYFQLGWRLYEQIQKVLVSPMTSVAMATAARAEGDHALLRRLLVGATRASSFIAYPAFVGTAVIAPTAIPLLFGSHWQGAVVPAQILALVGIRAAISGFNGGVMRGLGRADLNLLLVAAGFAFTLVAVPLAAPHGVAMVALAVLLRSFVTWPLGAVLVERLIGLPAWVQARTGLEAALAALAMAGVVLGLQAWLGHWPPVALMLLLVAAGAAAYAASLALFAPSTARALGRAARAAAGGDRKAARAHLVEASQAHVDADLLR